jgi:putative methyltransferase (TIGR04325 family)
MNTVTRSSRRSASPAGAPCGIGPVIGDSLFALRLWQIRRTASLFALLNRVGPTARILRAVHSVPPARLLLDKLMGFQSAFVSLPEARTIAERYSKAGRRTPARACDPLGLTASAPPAERVDPGHWSCRAAILARPATARPSDYPALFHIGRLVPDLTSLFDLGGNVGNLFYCFAGYLDFRPDLRWTVYELPEVLKIGQDLALGRREDRIRFTRDLQDASGSDVFLASGSLHYFDQSLPEVIGFLKDLPKHVIVNRTPMTTSKEIATVQDGGDHLVACRVIHKADFIYKMGELGYSLADSWLVPELSVNIALYPEYSVSSYSGLYFRLDHDRRSSLPDSRIAESRMS